MFVAEIVGPRIQSIPQLKILGTLWRYTRADHSSSYLVFVTADQYATLWTAIALSAVWRPLRVWTPVDVWDMPFLIQYRARNHVAELG